MDENEKSPVFPTGVVLVGLAVLSLPVLYVLSVGPALLLWPGQAPRVVEAFYRPLVWLMEQSETFKAIVEWYAKFFSS